MCPFFRIHLNGEFIGVYVNVERIDVEFVKRNFPGAKRHIAPPASGSGFLPMTRASVLQSRDLGRPIHSTRRDRW